MKPDDTLTHAEVINKLFGIKLSKHEKLRGQLRSITRNDLVEEISIPSLSGRNDKRYIPVTELTAAHNAILLLGIFGDPLNVKKIFTNGTFRAEMADWLSLLLLERQSVLGISIYPTEILTFISLIKNVDIDLKQQRLPNPFVQLPQIALESKTDILQGLLAQSALMSSSDNMMIAYLNGRLSDAFTFSLNIHSDNPMVLRYKTMIAKEYKEAVNFEKTLENFL